MPKPLISCIIPVFNHANTLEQSVLSIFKQTHRPVEIVIVNDGSTDNFAEVIEKIKVQAERTKIDLKVLNQSNSGAPVARNSGFMASTGEYVIFWDADTVGKPEMLKTMLKTLEENLQASYAYSQFKFGWKTMYSSPFDEQKLKETNYIDTTSLIRRQVFICDAVERNGKARAFTFPRRGATTGFNTSSLAAKNYNFFPSFEIPRGKSAGSFIKFDESLKRFQDWDLWLNMLAQKKYGVFIPRVLFKKLTTGREGISGWLPAFVYKICPKNKKVVEYEQAKEVIVKKHNL